MIEPEPVYDSAGPSEPILLRANKLVELTSGISPHSTTASVEIQWLPKPRVVVTCDLDATHGIGFDGDDVEIALPSLGSKVRAFPAPRRCKGPAH